jgi:hypothetical protein
MKSSRFSTFSGVLRMAEVHSCLAALSLQLKLINGSKAPALQVDKQFRQAVLSV